MSPVLRNAMSSDDYAAFAKLCRAYVGWCRARYDDMPWFVDEVFGHQDLEAELAVLPSKYGPPEGRTMLAVADGVVVAAGAWRRRSASVCELSGCLSAMTRGVWGLVGD